MEPECATKKGSPTSRAIGVVQTRRPVPVAELQRVFVEAGVWIRPFNDVIYLMPPFVIDADDLNRLTRAIWAGLDALAG